MVGLVHSLKNKKEVFMNVNDLAKQVSSIITPQTDKFLPRHPHLWSFLPQYKRHDVVGRCRNEISDARSV